MTGLLEQRAKTQPTQVQTLIFDASKFTAAKAKAWAKQHGFHAGGIDATEDSIRIRQEDPEKFKPGSFRTIELTNGVKAVIGKLKSAPPAKRDAGHGHSFGHVVLIDDEDSSPFVERPAPGAAPTAFRIWHAGENPTDDGPDIFSERSAELLLEEQIARGNLYSIDFDHLSLTDNRPADAGRAAGWHRLEVRRDAAGEAELWATEVEWCTDAKAGLEENPPRWRYFSPAFDIDAETREVIRYINTALCINPATWHNNQLATRNRKAMNMDKAAREKLAVLDAMKATMTNAEAKAEHKAAAEAMYATHGGEEEHEKLKAMAEEEAEPPPSSEESPATSRSPGSAPPPKKDGEGEDDDEDDEAEEEKRKAEAAKAATRSAARRPEADDPGLMKTVNKLAARVEELEKEQTKAREERRASRVAEILRSRKDLAPATRAALKGLRPSQVKAILDSLPKPSTEVRSQGAGSGTRGAGQGSREAAAPRVVSEVRRAMNLPEEAGPVPGFGQVVNGQRVFHTRRPTAWRSQQTASNAGKGN